MDACHRFAQGYFTTEKHVIYMLKVTSLVYIKDAHHRFAQSYFTSATHIIDMLKIASHQGQTS